MENEDEPLDEIDEMIMKYAASVYRFREAKRKVLEQLRRRRLLERKPEPN